MLSRIEIDDLNSSIRCASEFGSGIPSEDETEELCNQAKAYVSLVEKIESKKLINIAKLSKMFDKDLREGVARGYNECLEEIKSFIGES